MGIIVCQKCDRIVEHFDSEKVSVLYAACKTCDCKKSEDQEK